jgi:hypothetical protein
MKQRQMDKVLRGIEDNNAFYHFIVDCAEQAYTCGDLSASMHFCQEAASYATFQYCGFYAEPQLERLLVRIRQAAHIVPLGAPVSRDDSQLRILHYATSIFDVGGHTRLIENWIRNDETNCHDVMLTRQTVPVPLFIQQAVQGVRGTIMVLDSADNIGKAHQLAAIAGNYDIIILHHHPDDVVPLLALADKGRAVPVCVLNHGDHRYWLGVTVCDLLVEIRDNIIEADQQRRGIRNFSLLPIPVNVVNTTNEAYGKSRANLGIQPEQIMILSIGSSYKYGPIDEKNFFDDITPILDKYQQLVLVIVGIENDSALAIRYAHPRLRFVAPTMHLTDFHNACDIYLEGYPFSSFTAYLEVGALGKPICRMYDPPLLNTYKIGDYISPVYYPQNREEWQNHLQLLIADSQARLDAGNRELANNSIHAAQSIQRYIKKVYSKAITVAGKAVNNSCPIESFYGVNDRYLYKMQHNTKRVKLGVFYQLPLKNKLQLISIARRIILSDQQLSVRDLLWFLFKAR